MWSAIAALIQALVALWKDWRDQQLVEQGRTEAKETASREAQIVLKTGAL